MEVETKFNIDDCVWVIYDNKAVQQKVKGIEIQADNVDDVEVTYTLSNEKKYPESKVFKTKEELVDSL